MATPDIRIFYWGKRGGIWNWWQAGYRLNGVERSSTSGEPNDYYPIAYPGPNGDYTLPSIVSDAVFSGTTPFATVPIAIVNVGSGTLEEFNFDVVSHYWATGNGSSGGGFNDTWWHKNKDRFGSTPTFVSTNGHTSYSDLGSNMQNEDNNLWYREGLRVPDPSGIDPLPDAEDALDSKWNAQVSDIYNAQHTGWGAIRSSAGDAVLSALDRTNILTVANRKTIIGDLTAGSSSTGGYYATTNYRSTGGYTQNEGCMTNFTRRTAGNWTANEINVWRFGHVWSTARGNGQRKITPFNDYTIKVINNDSRYWLTNTNSDIMEPGRILRGYLWTSVYDKNQMAAASTDNIPAIISGGTGLEGAVFGRFFNTLSVFGRYYA